MQASRLPHQLPGAIFSILLFLCTGCGGSGASAPAPLSAEQQTANYFEQIRNAPAQLRDFLYRMPKGGDIHNHLSGAVKSESYIKWAVELGDCVNLATMKLYVPPCDAQSGLPPVLEAIQDPGIYNAMIDAFSMRGLAPGVGHDHFFATFDKFGAVSSVKSGDMLAEVMSDWRAQNVAYLELMLSLQSSNVRGLVKGVTWDINEMPAIFANLLADPRFAQYLSAARANLDSMEARMKVLLRCGQAGADPACANNMTVRYIYQVSRTLPPIEVFAQAAFAFELSSIEPRLVGVNLVQQEDNPVALADYTTQMRMFEFLGSAVPGVNIALHAGELAPAFVPSPSDLTFHIRQAVEIAKALRIGHGVDALWEDMWPQLMDEMAGRRTLVEICLTSNLDILAVSGTEHPFQTYREMGVPVTLASDDAGVFRIDLTHEYQYATTTYGLHYLDLKTLARNSLEYDFLPGQSLWQSTQPFTMVSQCAQDQPDSTGISPGCSAFLQQSKHAWQQWELEANFASFEGSIAAEVTPTQPQPAPAVE